MRRLGVALTLLLLAGCVYYNGMYNTKRLAGSARKAEREGRTFEANNLWGQVAVKAESVLVRHPNSKWTDEARLLRGTALVRLRDCTAALRPLEEVMTGGSHPDLVEEAAVLVGTCRVNLGDPAGAVSAYSRLTKSRDPARRALALYAHGRALRVGGQYQEALEELTGSEDPRARGERAAALAGLGRVPEALALADSLIVARDTAAPWDSLLAAVGRHDSDSASALTDRLVRADFPAETKVRLLLQDAIRVRPDDRARSDARLAEARSAGGSPAVAAQVRFAAALLRLAEAESTAVVARQADEFDELSESVAEIGPRAVALSTMGHRVAAAADSTVPGSPQGDLRLFLIGELARDSLAAPRFAASQFRRVAVEWPGSPFAPKALLALILLEPQAADSLREVLVRDYPQSPYVAVAEGGGESPEFQVFEDSLRRFAAGFRPEGRRVAPVRTTRPVSGSPRQPDQ